MHAIDDSRKDSVEAAISEENKTLYELKNSNGIVVDKNRIKRFQTTF
jgi:hypothetical protein